MVNWYAWWTFAGIFSLVWSVVLWRKARQAHAGGDGLAWLYGACCLMAMLYGLSALLLAWT